MFRMPKAIDVITLFHAPHVPSSIRMHNLLKLVHARAGGFEADPKWSEFSYKAGPIPHRSPFELHIATSDPTPTQMATILDYVKEAGFSATDVVEGSEDRDSALKMVRRDPNLLRRPLVVDWSAGWAVPGDFPERVLRRWVEDGKRGENEEGDAKSD